MSDSHFGAVNTPVYRASTILYPDLAAIKANTQPYTYGRRGTPTTAQLRGRDLRPGRRARAPLRVTSGLQAIGTGDPVGVQRRRSSADGGQLSMSRPASSATRTLKRFGIETSYYRAGRRHHAHLKPNTRAVFCESPGSLTFEVQDIPAIASGCRMRNGAVGADGQYLGDAAVISSRSQHGVDLSIQAATKYIGGHADVMLGYVAANESHAGAAAPGPWRSGALCQRRRLLPGPAGPAHPGRPAGAPSGDRRSPWPAGCRPGRRSPASSIPPWKAIPAMPCGNGIFPAPAGCSGVVLKPVSEAADGRLCRRVAAFRDRLFLGRV